MINTALIFLGLVSSATLTFSVGDFAVTGPMFAEATEIFAFAEFTTPAFAMV